MCLLKIVISLSGYLKTSVWQLLKLCVLIMQKQVYNFKPEGYYRFILQLTLL